MSFFQNVFGTLAAKFSGADKKQVLTTGAAGIFVSLLAIAARGLAHSSPSSSAAHSLGNTPTPFNNRVDMSRVAPQMTEVKPVGFDWKSIPVAPNPWVSGPKF